MQVNELRSWAKCAGCGEVLWVEPWDGRDEDFEQRAGCACGGLSLHNDEVVGSTGALAEASLQTMLDEEYGVDE